MAKMKDDELASLIDAEVRQSIGYYAGELAEQRRTALAYYYGEPFGNEVEGRSTVVSRDVADTIEWIMPTLMKIFTATDEVVRFEPQGPEDEAGAKQATDYVNYIFGRQNNGFVALYSFFKDALLQKNGFLKVYWEEYSETETETYENLSDDEFMMVMQAVQALQDEGTEVELKEHEVENGFHSLKYKVTTKHGKLCVDPVPPEEVLISRRASWDLQKARFVAHRSRKTVSELNEMGFNTDEIGESDDSENTLENIQRFKDEQGSLYQTRDDVDPTMREIWVTEAYPMVDYDGDGIAERRMVTVVSGKILEYKKGGSANVEIDRVPLVTCTPILMPHKLIGLSIADLVMDLQLIKSTVFRQVLDNMYLTNNSRMMVLDGMANIDDLLTVRPGGIVRVKAFDAVKPLQAPSLGAPAFQLLEYIDTIRENRTGVTRYNQGLDADSLNKTATGISTIYNASQQRIELIARIFAETGVKDLFWSILALVQKHSSKQQMMRLNNTWTPIDPREWKNKFDMSVSVGLGTGSHSQQLQGMQLVGQMQAQIAASPLFGMVVTPQNIYNAAICAAKAIDPKRANTFFTDPQGQMPQPPPPDPKIAANMEKAKMQDDTKKKIKAVDLISQQAQFTHEKEMAHMDQTHETNMTGLDLLTQGMQQQQEAEPPMPGG